MSARGTLLLLGGGGHAAVVADSARSSGWEVAGFLDDAAGHPQADRAGLARLGAPHDLAAVLAALPPGTVALAAVGDPGLRRRWLDLVGKAAAPAIVHDRAVVSPSATLGPGVLIGPLAVVNARAVIQRGAIVNSGAIVEHDCNLGAFCHVAPGAALGGAVRVGPDCLVGINAAVRPGLRLGASARVGAGSVVLADVPDGATAVGAWAGTGDCVPTPAQAGT